MIGHFREKILDWRVCCSRYDEDNFKEVTITYFILLVARFSVFHSRSSSSLPNKSFYNCGTFLCPYAFIVHITPLFLCNDNNLVSFSISPYCSFAPRPRSIETLRCPHGACGPCPSLRLPRACIVLQKEKKRCHNQNSVAHTSVQIK